MEDVKPANSQSVGSFIYDGVEVGVSKIKGEGEQNVETPKNRKQHECGDPSRTEALETRIK